MFSSGERRAALTVLMICCALVAGCGGGGGGGGGSTPQNRAPTLGTVQFSTNEDTDVSAQVTGTDPDGDALTFTRTGDPTKGAVTAFATNGSFTYRPNRDAFGNDTFAVRVADSRGSGVNGTVTIAIAATADPPAAQNDLLTATTASLANLNVLANDVDPDGDTPTVTIASPAEVGTATVNAGGSIAISGLPAGFRGVTRFQYRIADPSNASSIGTAVVFVDVEPFRVIFAADEPGQDSPEVFVTNLASAPVQLTNVSVGADIRLRTFVASNNGSTVAYRLRDQAQGNLPLGLSFLRTANPTTAVPIQLPAGMQLQPQVSQQLDTYAASPDGQWIAGIVTKEPPGTSAVFLVNVADPTVIHTPTLPDVSFAQDLQFSSDSQFLYFLSSGASNGNTIALYRTAVATPDQSEQMSAAAPPAPGFARVFGYVLAPDQSRIMLVAERDGVTNLYYVSTANPRNEIRLNHALDPGDEIVADVPRFGPTPRVAYTTAPGGTGTHKTYIAEISATPNPRRLGSDEFVIGDVRPDGQAVLLLGSLPSRIVEQQVDSAQTPTLVGDTEDYFNMRYDARGDALVSQVSHEVTPGTIYLTIAAAVSPTFGTTQHVGTPDEAALFTNFTGTDRAILLMGEGPQVQPVPPVQTFRMAIANAWAPDKLLYVTDLITPRILMGGRGRVVDP